MTMITNQFGDPFLTRKSEISEKATKTNTLFPFEVMGKYQRLKQITVRIGFPVYRIKNGRTRTFQKEYLATHSNVAPDIFTTDPESMEAQRVQHEILQKLVEDEDLLKEFQSGTQQTEPLIITSTGVVVNGNRRLCAWRTLFYREPEKYKHFKFVDVAVLPEDCDEEEIKTIEKRLQIQKTHRAEYKWHSTASMMREEQEGGVLPELLAKSYDTTKKEVGLLIGALEYADIYLKKIGKPDQWSLVDSDEFAFKAIVEERKKIADQGRKELFETVCFKLIENKDYQGRLYSNIPEIAEHLDVIAFTLREQGLLPNTESESGVANIPESEHLGTEQDEDLSLLGGVDVDDQKDTYSELASALQTSAVKLGGLVKQVIDEQKSIKAEQKNSKYLINSLSRISGVLRDIRSHGLNENTSLAGVQAQIDAIKEGLVAIEQWIINHN